MYQIDNRYNFYNEILIDFKSNSNLSDLDIMILEVVCYKLDEIEKQQVKKKSIHLISNSQYVYIYNNKKIINIFLNEDGICQINPIKEYGKDIIDNFKIIKLVKSKVSKNLNINDINKINKVCEIIIEHIVRELDITPECITDTLFSDYYFNYIYGNDISFENNEISKKEQRDTILYLIENKSSYQILDINDYLKSFYIYRNFGYYEKIRVVILYFLQNKYPYVWYADNLRFYKEQNKLNFEKSMLFLFKELYECKYDYNFENNCGVNELLVDHIYNVFKKEIIVNYHIRKLYFDALEILLKDPNQIGYIKINELLK